MRTWLKEIRKTKELSQQCVADNCGISRSFYADIERGTRNPKVDTAKEIGNYLGFDWTIFFEKIGRKTSHGNVKSA